MPRPRTTKAKEPWLVFTFRGREICSYTVRGTFAGEREATTNQLAFDRGVSPSEIGVALVMR